MKRVLFLLLFVFSIGFVSYTQSNTSQQEDNYIKNLNLTAKDSLMFYYLDGFQSQLREPAYQLYKTQNTWTFLKLNTVTGQIWQVQYRFQTDLDTNIRILENYDEPICGRFTLYPTDNMYNFILLDQIDGRCWQVQWNIDSDKRGVWRIY